MCNAAAMTSMQVGSGVFQAMNNINLGKQTEDYNKYISDQARAEVDLTLKAGRTNAGYVMDAAARDTLTVKNQSDRVAGSQRVAMAANGIAGDSVTAEDLAVDSLSKANLDELAIRHNANSKVTEILDQSRWKAADLNNKADNYLIAGRNAKKAGAINAATTLLTTAGSVADTWQKYNQTSKGA